MYAQYSNNMNIQFSSTASPFLPSPSPIMHLTEFDLLHEYTLSQLNNNNNSCSSTSSSPNSVASSTLMQRSVSSHSLHHQNGTHHHPLSALFAEFLDSSELDAPVRRVYSTGDLQRINGKQRNHHLDSPLSSESSMIIEGMSRVCRYSPEEKKVRIERYRTKRNQRNFNKKIKYACRKTLADRRPRIRGRFARNDEIGKNTTIQWSHIIGTVEEEDEEDENWVSIFDSIVAANLAHESQGSSSFGLLY